MNHSAQLAQGAARLRAMSKEIRALPRTLNAPGLTADTAQVGVTVREIDALASIIEQKAGAALARELSAEDLS